MIAIVFNPTARGDRALALKQHLEGLSGHFQLLPTRSAGDAVELARQAVALGAHTVVAAGGDGTVNEVVNGLMSVSDGQPRVRLAVLPLGTVNVFARELGLPLDLESAWQVVLDGSERLLDVGVARWGEERRWFVQLAGAGLDAEAIRRVRWKLKRRLGKMAYLWAGLEALNSARTRVEVVLPDEKLSGELVLIGNGRLYGGSFDVFPQADLADGRLDVLVFPKVTVWVLFRWLTALFLRRQPPQGLAMYRSVPAFGLQGPAGTPFQLEGDSVGQLPARFEIEPKALSVLTGKPAVVQPSTHDLMSR